MTDGVRAVSPLLTLFTLGDPSRDARRIPNDEPLTRRRPERPAIAAHEQILNARRKLKSRRQTSRRANPIDPEEPITAHALAVCDDEPLASHRDHAIRMNDPRGRLGGVSFLVNDLRLCLPGHTRAK